MKKKFKNIGPGVSVTKRLIFVTWAQRYENNENKLQSKITLQNGIFYSEE
jgi:hypothetical protein